MTQFEFRAALSALNLNITSCAKALGMGRQQVGRYANGHWPVPVVVELALEGLKARNGAAK